MIVSWRNRPSTYRELPSVQCVARSAARVGSFSTASIASLPETTRPSATPLRSVASSSFRSRATMPTKYWSYAAYGNVSLSFKKIKTWVDLPLELTIYQKTQVFAQARNIWLVNPSVRKTLTKDDRLEAKLSVFDLLNQNSYVNRDVNSNFIMENTQNGIQRNIMFSLLFHFSKNGKPMQ